MGEGRGGGERGVGEGRGGGERGEGEGRGGGDIKLQCNSELTVYLHIQIDYYIVIHAYVSTWT